MLRRVCDDGLYSLWSIWRLPLGFNELSRIFCCDSLLLLEIEPCPNRDSNQERYNANHYTGDTPWTDGMALQDFRIREDTSELTIGPAASGSYEGNSAIGAVN